MADAAWSGTGSGTVISVLKKIASAGGSAVTIADGADVAQGTTSDLSSASTVVGLLKAIKAAVQGTLPVSIATNTPDVTDRSGRLLGTIANTGFVANAGTNLNTSALALDATLTGGTQKAIARSAAKGTSVAADLTSNPIDGNTQALHVDGSKVTQPVSLATNTPDVTDRTARLLGHVTVDSAPTTAVTIASLPALAAGTALIGQVAASNETNTIYQGTTVLTPKFATIVASASGATQVVAAVTNKRIRVLAVVLVANAAVNAKFQSHVTPTDITGLAYLAANTGFSAGFSPVGLFQTISGEALDINLSGAVAVGGFLVYVEA